MQNVYRQFIACSFLLAALSFAQARNVRVSLVLFLLSGLSQNVGLIFLPLLFAFNIKNKRLSYKFIFSALSVLILLPFAVSTKSSSDTGVLGVEVYAFLFILVMGLYVFSLKGVMNYIFAKYLYFLIYLFSLILVSAVILGNAQSKRVGMICLLLAIIPLTAIVESKFKNRLLVRSAYIIIVTLPTFVFTSAFSMLQTALYS